MENISPAEKKLQDYFDQILFLVEKTSKSEEDSILLAGAMMSVARILYFDNLSKEEVIALEIPTGAPIIYSFAGKKEPISKENLFE